MPEIEYERGTNDLPQGAAGDINEVANAITPDSGLDMPIAPSEELPMPELGEEGPDYTPQDEAEQLLFADSEGKGRDFQAPRSNYVPSEVVRKLPALQRAASRSDAPPALVALYRMTVRALEDEMRQNG